MTNADKIRAMTDEQLSVLLQMGAWFRWQSPQK
jgi:hypothetical protein